MNNQAISTTTTLLAAAVLAGGTTAALAGPDRFQPRPIEQGPCAFLPADRATEFHGNAEHSDLNLGMAGNQWVVFDKVMQGFNLMRGTGDGTEPQHHPNPFWTLAELNDPARQYYIQLIPPGQIRDQIKSGCMVLGNDEERNFLPGSIQVDFDVFASTNYNLMRDLAANGFLTEAKPYIKNKLDLMVAEGNPLGIGTAGATGTYAHIQDIVMDLLDPAVRVSEVDHINEGIHRAINNMYKAMDELIREQGPAADIAALDAALAAVATPQPGSPADTRTGVSTDFNLATNPECHYSGHPSIPDGTLRFCEFAILNKASTHETRVHHVETPSGILGEPGFAPVDVGPVWISELGYQLVRSVPVEGMVPGAFPPPGVVGPDTADPTINAPATYSIAVLRKPANATENGKRRQLAEDFTDFVRSPAGQTAYTDGGFIGLTPDELAAGECYALDKDGNLVITPRDGGC
ncbi:MAG: hypothetical protein CMN57_06010 [Gammaproteobacteria bacterium]|nr:hypothetical protein [Gammaproteobacteria bacterium]